MTLNPSCFFSLTVSHVTISWGGGGGWIWFSHVLYKAKLFFLKYWIFLFSPLWPYNILPFYSKNDFPCICLKWNAITKMPNLFRVQSLTICHMTTLLGEMIFSCYSLQKEKSDVWWIYLVFSLWPYGLWPFHRGRWFSHFPYRAKCFL